ncbi:MAG: CPBP family intramembrane metalloprotease [Thermaerobacter sp.]|nr:CPBP family intramembrane metalloprotease [Thermaerobacter sp.]
MLPPRRRGAIARAVLAPFVAYAALFAASTLSLLILAVLRGHGADIHLQLILTTSAVRRLMRELSPDGVVLSQILGEAATIVAMGLWLRKDVRLADILDRRPRLGDLGFGLMATGGLLVLVEVIGIILLLLHAVQGSLTQRAFVQGIGPPWLLLLMAIVAGFAEETTFRGYVLRSLRSLLPSRMIWLAIILESAIFAAFHLGWGLAPGPFVVIFAIGVALSLLVLRSNIYIAMVAHAGYDTIAFLIALHVR